MNEVFSDKNWGAKVKVLEIPAVNRMANPRFRVTMAMDGQAFKSMTTADKKTAVDRAKRFIVDARLKRVDGEKVRKLERQERERRHAKVEAERKKRAEVLKARRAAAKRRRRNRI